MVKPIDVLGFGPKRTVEHVGDTWIISITPPEMFVKNPRTVKVVLTHDQYVRYQRWMRGELIQVALPDLSPGEREKLMTGLG